MDNSKPSLFNRLFMEAPDDPPDITGETTEEVPPDNPPPDATEEDTLDTPPDEGGGDMSDDAPPDIDSGEDPFGSDDPTIGTEEDQEGTADAPNVSEKISIIMNRGLFQKFLTLLNTIGLQISSIKSNSDILFSLSTDTIDILKALEKLDENIRLYLSNQFEEENYSSNLLFFNKCVNLLTLLNEDLDKGISKGTAATGGDQNK